MTPAERRAALELEVDRLKARLDSLAAQIDGDPAAWLSIQEKLGGEVAEVLVDKLLAEARQHAVALASIIRTLDGTAPKAKGEDQPMVDPGDQIAAKRAARLAAAQA